MALVASLAFEPQLGFSDRVAQLLDRIDCRPADSAEDREAIFRLRYEAYLREGAIAPNFLGTFWDPYDDADNAWLFGLYLDGELASSLRLHIATREHPDSPSHHVFPDLLQPELTYATVRLAWLAAEHFEADHFLVAVRAEHQAFYRRTFNHRLICEPRPYPLLAKPISLMTVHYPSAADWVHQRYPFFRSTFFERRMLFERDLAVPQIQFRSDAVPVSVHHAA
jgi:hypothetical protein